MRIARPILFLLGCATLVASASDLPLIQGLGVRVKPEVLVANPGRAVAFSLVLTRVNSDAPVQLEIQGAPAGSKVSISENPVTASNREPVIILDIPASAEIRTYPLSIQAGGVKTSASLIVQP